MEFVQAPLVPYALAVTFGLVLDRYVGGSSEVGLLIAGVAIVSRLAIPRIWLVWLAAGGLGFAYHHAHRNEFSPDDIAAFAQTGPQVVMVRGVVAEEPQSRKLPIQDPLQPRNRRAYDSTILECRSIQVELHRWAPVSGRVRLRIERDAVAPVPMNGARPGDFVEVVGQFTRTQGPSNPGERDLRERDLDQRIRGDIRSNGSGSLTRLEAGDWSLTRTLAWLRGYGVRALESNVSAERVPVARALLLGDGSAMDRAEWDSYIRTGVVHVLAISGQHLVLLAAFAWFVLGMVGVPARRAAWIVVALVFTYAMLTGLRPSAFRAAIMVAAIGGAVILRRPVSPANAFAAAWLAVILLNPCDAFDLGGRLSFLSVFVLIWGIGRYRRTKTDDPVERLIDSTRPAWVKRLRALGRAIAIAYLVNLVLFVVNTPLLISEQNLASPVSLIVGPILVLLTSVALVAGFLLLVLAPLPGLGEILGGLVQVPLRLANEIVQVSVELPGGAIYLPGLPRPWLIGFYAIVAVLVLVGQGNRSPVWKAMLVWIGLGLLWPTSDRPDTGELRVTYLAVGHGGCTVLETDDGRCYLYDLGTAPGPDVVRRVVAPYLWHRGIRKVDELFISHADSDHFNGVPELLQRFPVGRITVTPSFAEKPTAEVAEMLAAVKRQGTEMRTAIAGQRFESGDITFDVLHPPASGPGVSENERSLVVTVRHGGHTLLFTGDLEKAGTTMLLQQPHVTADVVQAPHHGSRIAFPDSFAVWCTPKFIIVNRGDLYSNFIRDGHAGLNSPIWDTQAFGAVTLRSNRSGLNVESFRTKDRIVIVRGGS